MSPDAELRLPAEAAYVSVLRATAVSLAARLDFTVDDLEDLKMAVSEAASLVLDQAEADGSLDAAFFFGAGRLTVTVGARTAHPAPVPRDDFAWQLLSALTVDAGGETTEDAVSVTFTIVSLASA
ncbi:anti-sigma factor [Nocardioides alcanivorans]|uniref:anti-sigma factor n=1 Tax=Nocardioides alcanivorans TaxID=2897352 RepID=UPI001F1B1676|nr:anti-sigma factor [Nocardioides alcanivorans]